MRRLVDYIRGCFCRHDWELIFHGRTNEMRDGEVVSFYHTKIYRCKKCGCSKKYRSY
jgi:hypothetical protein